MSSPGLEQAVPSPPSPAPSRRRPSRATPRPARRSASPPRRWRANLVAVVFTVIFTRILGADGYGSLAALLNLTVILFVPGSALQVAAAREATLGRLGRGGELAGTLERWSRHILIALVVVAVVSVAGARAAGAS